MERKVEVMSNFKDYGADCRAPRGMYPWYDLVEPNSPVRAVRDYPVLRHKQPGTKVGCFNRSTPVPVDGAPLYGNFYMIIRPSRSRGHRTKDMERLAYALGYQLECTHDTVMFFEDAPTNELRVVVPAEALGIKPTPFLPLVFETMARKIAAALHLRSARLDVYAAHYCTYESIQDVWEEIGEKAIEEAIEEASEDSEAVTRQRYKPELLEWDVFDGGHWYFDPGNVRKVLKRDDGGCMNGLDYLRLTYSEAVREVEESAAPAATSSSAVAGD
jgi:hypothetical protein